MIILSRLFVTLQQIRIQYVFKSVIQDSWIESVTTYLFGICKWSQLLTEIDLIHYAVCTIQLARFVDLITLKRRNV